MASSYVRFATTAVRKAERDAVGVYSYRACPCAPTPAPTNAVRGRLASTRRRTSLPARHLASFSSITPFRNACRSYANTSGPPRDYGTPSAPGDELTLSDAQRRTIYALSTPPGKAGVAVVRVSGPDALEVRRRMVVGYPQQRRSRAGKEPASVPADTSLKPWRMERCRVVDAETGETLDDGLSVFFKGPRSFTSEDVLELHLHSGRAIIASVLRSLALLPFCRPAEPGEFTRRAFTGGRLDLTQVEGLRDLIDADTETQRRAALHAAGGVARARFDDMRSEIISCLALVEALIDFGEGEDIEEGVFAQAKERAEKLRQIIKGHLADGRRGEILRSGVRVTIFGPPNAGKSSLLNFLAQREAAIVTPVPGTTRDILEVSLDLGGLPLLVSDTAGLRDASDVVERIGVERARHAINAADIALCVLSLPDVLVDDSASAPSLALPPMAVVLPDIARLITPSTFVLLNKADLVAPLPEDAGEAGSSVRLLSTTGEDLEPAAVWAASLSDGGGTREFLDGLANAIAQRYDMLLEGEGEAPLVTNARHHAHLESACRFLDAFLATEPNDVVLGAEELRYAARAVGKISGLIDVEDVLDSLFSEFCIGK